MRELAWGSDNPHMLPEDEPHAFGYSASNRDLFEVLRARLHRDFVDAAGDLANAAVGAAREALGGAQEELRSLRVENEQLRSEVASTPAPPKSAMKNNLVPENLAKGASAFPPAPPAELLVCSMSETGTYVEPKKPRLSRHSRTSGDSEHASLTSNSTSFLIRGHKEVSLMANNSKSFTKRNSSAAAANKIFGDTEEMKMNVRKALFRPTYTVTDFYKENSWASTIAQSAVFDSLTLFVICVNAIWISVDADLNPAAILTDAHPTFIVAENLFCTFFLFEILVRLFAFKKKWKAFKDAWFIFDLSLVVLMVVETWMIPLLVVILQGSGPGVNSGFLRLIRLARLSRLARMARVVRAVPEILILVKGLWLAARAVLVSLSLMFIIIYVFSVGFVMITMDSNLHANVFVNTVETMYTLLIFATFPDADDLVTSIRAENELVAGLFVFFLLVTSITILNMLIGILCEVVSVVSSTEKERMMVIHVQETLLRTIAANNMEADCSSKIDRAEFIKLLTTPSCARIIQDMGVDVEGLVDMEEFLFDGEPLLSLAELMSKILDLRGSNSATVKDLVDMRKLVLQEIDHGLKSVKNLISSRIPHFPRDSTLDEA
eukprot:TRINITY_DN19106_c0_g1_i1.p1 TRINITY_DN19106_c0_g1~~TRINITY_DN19106_c0_g1_i1.p1  ORF type:complete len:606 (+),score=121.79 TRINITY_DN19106_c0_g1_i1:112-1929(+)